MIEKDSSAVEDYQDRLDKATDYGEIWKIVKETAKTSLNKQRSSMMLFLDDLPIQLGAYHTVGTNNIVLNRTLIRIVETVADSKKTVNALVYNLLLHEYLHALGEFSEYQVREMVYAIAKKCFGENHLATVIAKKSPWALLKDIPLEAINVSKRVIEIVKGFEKTDKYIV